jgi:predicted amidophosphoribosyltransferase
MWTVGQLVIFAIVMAIVGGMAAFVWRVRKTFPRPTTCPSCNATVTRDTRVCPACGETL